MQKVMKRIALLVRHQTKPGMREEMRRVWESYIKAHAAQNPGHLAYHFCYDRDCDTGITAFQVFSDDAAREEFLASPWYPEYLDRVSEFITEAPVISSAEVIWSKSDCTTGENP